MRVRILSHMQKVLWCNWIARNTTDVIVWVRILIKSLFKFGHIPKRLRELSAKQLCVSSNLTMTSVLGTRIRSSGHDCGSWQMRIRIPSNTNLPIVLGEHLLSWRRIEQFDSVYRYRFKRRVDRMVLYLSWKQWLGLHLREFESLTLRIKNKLTTVWCNGVHATLSR